MCQVDQVADSFWDGPAQLVLRQSPVIKRPSQVRLSCWGAQKPQSGWDSSLQVCQVDQAADSFWDGPGQLVREQASMNKGPAKSDSLMSGSHKVDGIASLQVCQVDQIADSFWDGPAQLGLMQVSMIKGPTKSDPL